ncbi:MAG: Gfo/Idh/MocA family oxidoreductase [Lentisphaeria bacterium]|nr:Gfo/Idh/MocA family oxidoreductase [Lentisphaeria bacterium]
MEPIKAGIIGFGRSGCGIHANAIENMPGKFTVTAICDELPDRRKYDAFPNAKACAAAEEVINDPEVELVIVATYNYTHALYARKALEAGKHVLCEKPFGYTTADVDSMIAAAKKAGRILQPFQQRRFEPDFQKVLEICRSGILGKLTSIRIFWPGFGRRWDWQTSRTRGGGQLYNNGPHLIDHAVELFGPAKPTVTARLRNALSSGDAEDEFHVLLQAEGAPDTEIILSATCAYPQDRWLICGTAGTLRGNAEKLEWKYVDWSKYPERPLDMVPLEGRCYCSETKEFATGEWVRPEEQTDTGAGAKPAPGPTLALYESLYRSIRLGEPQIVTPEQVRRRIEVMQTCYIQNNIPFPENTLR